MSLMDNVKQLDTKQKGMLVATIGCLGLVFYLAYTTFFPAGSASAPVPENAPSPPAAVTIASAPPASAQQPGMTPISKTTGSLPTPLPGDNTQTATDQTVQVGKAAPPTPEDLALLAESQRMQQQYIQLVNEYQLAQLQQKLAQVDSQIAASKLTTTKSLVELKKLQPLLGVDLGGGQQTSIATSAGSNAPQGYQTMYVGEVSGKWQAMLENAGQYFQVSVGMRLPDGSVVSQINSRGVVITNANGVPVFLPMSKSLD